MQRRAFVQAIVGVAAAPFAPAGRHEASPQLAVTMDDFNWREATPAAATARNDALLNALKRHRIKAALLVTGRHLEPPADRRLLERWHAEGHLIGNHSYSHFNYHAPEITADEYIADAARGAETLNALGQPWFRFPYLREGNTSAKRDAMRRFLADRGIRNAHVTIDSSDWYLSQRLSERLAREPGADLTPYRAVYLDHLLECARFYDDLAKRVLGTPIRHTLLVHHNKANELFLDAALEMFVSKGWRLIDATAAFEDPVFTRAPDVVPAGNSLVWALARESGRFKGIVTRAPADDEDRLKETLDRLKL